MAFFRQGLCQGALGILIQASCVFLCLLVVAPAWNAGAEEEDVTLQLKWFHQFQFAGYYAAIEKGFFAEEDLRVTLLERDPAQTNMQPVLEGKAEYGVADSGLLVLRNEGAPVVVLAQIFQHSPLALLTRREDHLVTPSALAEKRLMVDIAGHSDAALVMMLKRSELNLDEVEVVPMSFNPADLATGKCDALSAYMTDQPFWFRQHDIQVDVLNPRDYGVDFYGDNLFTTEQEMRTHPDRVWKMVRATLRGWRYALDHPQEMIDLILEKYAPNRQREHLEYEAAMTATMIVPDLVPLGEINPIRYEQIAQGYASVGIMPAAVVPSGFIYEARQAMLLGLTSAERTWLALHPEIVLSVDRDYPPKNFLDVEGNLTGVSIDFLRLMEQRLGIHIRFEGSLWHEALDKALEHQVDGVVNADKLKEREDRLSFTEVYTVYPQALAVRAEQEDIGPLRSFSGRKVAVKRERSQACLIRERCPDAVLKEVDTVEEGLELLMEGQVDGVYDDIAVLHHWITARYLNNVRFAYVQYEPPVGYARIGLRNDAPELLSAFNKAIASITEEDRRRIQNKWIDIDLPHPTSEEAPADLGLTEEEAAWIDAHPRCRVAIDGHRAPIEFLSDDDNYAGIALDYLREIEALLGIEFEIVRGKTRTELLDMGRRGEVDMFTAVSPESGRGDFLTFGRPYLSFPVVLFARDDKAYITGLKELFGKRVGVVQGYSLQKWLERDHPGIELVPLPTIEDALSTLSRGQVAAVAANILTAGYVIREKGYTNIKVAGDTPYTYDLSLATRKDWPLLASALQKALSAIPETKRDEVRRQWVSVQYEHRFDYSLLWKTLAGAVLLLLLFALWNHHLAVSVRKRTQDLSLANEALRQEVEHRRKTEAELRESETRFRTTVDNAADGVFLNDLSGSLVDVNQSACDSLGYTREEMFSLSITDVDVHYKSMEEVKRFLADIGYRTVIVTETELRRKDGTLFPVELRVVKFDLAGEPIVLGMARDITARKAAEEERGHLEKQLRMAQKMEAIGQLAGGVAHDFNNLLQVITGHTDLAMAGLEPGTTLYRDLTEISRASERAARLVSQLLAFSRRQLLRLESLDLNAVIADILHMVERTIGEHVTLHCLPGRELGSIRADRGMMEQIVVNLCVNARDAMPSGGTLTIETENVRFDPSYCENHNWAKPGRYVLLSVTDTGCGMSLDTLSHVFEPFFTTKEFGRGTGLGLATVYGIVKQHDGLIHVYSEVGKGTTFKVYMPIVERAAASIGTKVTGPVPEGSETILVAEDDSMVRDLARQVLERAGYSVILAEDGVQAVAQFRKHRDEIHLLLLDVVMPNLGGKDARAQILQEGGNLPVLFSSGYSENAVHANFVLKEGIPLIQKPYRSEELLRAVRKALDGGEEELAAGPP